MNSQYRSLIRNTWSAPCWGWLLIFLIGNTAINLPINTNPRSRFATLCAMVEDRSFCIDQYKYLTIDWAQTPDGHYYSNKAPGPMLLGFPFFWVLDRILTHDCPDRPSRDQARISHAWITMKALALVLQVIPFSLVVASCLRWLSELGVSKAALHIASVAMLFGNTASLFMNTYFGHAMAATWVLALCLFLLKRSYAWAGMSYGLALLSDYGSGFLLPGFLLAVLLRESRQNWLKTALYVASGGLGPAILWIIYHTACFGSPFTLPLRYENPIFLDSDAYSVLGLFMPLPKPFVVFQLLFGWQRGLLWSQPWMLLVIGIFIVQYRRLSQSIDAIWKPSQFLLILLFPTFFVLLLLNASFTGWQGGCAVGPRYMCSIFPAIGLLAGPLYGRLSRPFSLLFALSVFPSVLLWILCYSTTITIPERGSAWGYTLNILVSGSTPTALLCFTGLFGLLNWQLVRAWLDCHVLDQLDHH